MLIKKIVLYSVSTLIIILSNISDCKSVEQSTIGCHCFKNRAYNPQDIFAADDYILATSFNSLLSKYFGISKRQIVLLKMQGGISQDDLIIGLSLSKSSQVALQHILELRKKKGPWQQVINDPIFSDRQPPLSLSEIQLKAIKTQSSSYIADETISLFFSVPAKTINSLKTKDLTEKEITLILILNNASNTPIGKIVEEYRNEKKSWSGIAHSLGVEPSEAGKLILSFQKKH